MTVWQYTVWQYTVWQYTVDTIKIEHLPKINWGEQKMVMEALKWWQIMTHRLRTLFLSIQPLWFVFIINYIYTYFLRVQRTCGWLLLLLRPLGASETCVSLDRSDCSVLGKTTNYTQFYKYAVWVCLYMDVSIYQHASAEQVMKCNTNLLNWN